MQELVGFLVFEDKKIKENCMNGTDSQSENIARYYDCVSGWNPVWMQSKPIFENQINKIHSEQGQMLDH